VSHFGLRQPVALVALLLLMLALAGCGGAGEANPREIGPRGVDELVIPTPDPDPSDFVAAVDNPWLPLAPGTRWTYEVSGSVVRQLDVVVEGDRKEIAGIPCVVVHQTGIDVDGETVVEGDSYYAQDARGNVWLFGEEGRVLDPDQADLLRSWAADESGAAAGLAMPAAPRVGDGFLRQRSSSVNDRSSVVSLDEERTVPAGTFGGLLFVQDTLNFPNESERVLERVYAEGVGLVEQASTSTSALDLALVSVTTPADQVPAD
jgi:hypothetical protein